VREITISRREALGGLAAVGAGVAGAGLGTRALLSDSEAFANNSVTAGELDLKVAWRKTVVQGATTIEETSSDFPTPTDEVDAPICDLSDIKPGDSGYIEFVLRIDDNPGYLSLVGMEQADRENGQPEPERGALSESVTDIILDNATPDPFDGYRLEPFFDRYPGTLDGAEPDTDCGQILIKPESIENLNNGMREVDDPLE